MECGLYFLSRGTLSPDDTEKPLSSGLFNLIQIRMDKEKILPKLTQMVGKTSLSERTISDYAASVASLLTDEFQLTEEFYTAHANVLKSMGGNFSRDVAAQVEEAKKNLPTPQTPPAMPPATPPTEEKPQWAKDIEDQIKIFKEDRLYAQKQAQRNEIFENIRKIALSKDSANEKSGWASNAGVLNVAFGTVQIEDTDTEETISNKCQAEYNKRYVEIFGKSDSVPGIGMGGSASEISAEERAKAISENQRKYRNQQV